MDDQKIYVWADWFQDNRPVLIGLLFVERLRGQEVFSFEYDEDWLGNINSAFFFDPALMLYAGRQYSYGGEKLFGIFTDSCPDRWGRTLMDRRERIMAERENRPIRKLTESDYLLGVADLTRIGGLRFSTDLNGPFLTETNEYSAPPIKRLRELEQISLEYEKSSEKPDKWVSMLVSPGSSLGGARPKANVIDEKGDLWIAKFPSHKDNYNVGAWEKTAYDLAGLCGLNVAQNRIEKLSSSGDTFLVKRFDRAGQNRIHFISAMTALGKTDREQASYLELVSFIRSNGIDPDADLQELWRRIAFNMLISNTDDHLRNHGFLLSTSGWRLSPLYDINPNPDGEYLSLLVDDYDDRISKDLAISVASLFNISNNEAEKTYDNMRKLINDRWHYLAKQNGLSRSEIEMMSPAFKTN